MKTIQAPIDFINDNWPIYNRLVLSGLNKYEIKRTMQISERQYHVLLSYKPKQPINTYFVKSINKLINHIKIKSHEKITFNVRFNVQRTILSND